MPCSFHHSQDQENIQSSGLTNLCDHESISPDSISGLRPAALNDFSKRQVKALTDEQLAGLSKKQIRRADDFIDALSNQQLAILSFNPARFNRLTDPLDPFNGLEFATGQDPLA